MKTFLLHRCRALYRLGILLLQPGLLLTAVGLGLGLFHRGWIMCLVGLGLVLAGIFVGQTGEGVLGSEIKHLFPSMTAKEVHEAAARHLRAKDADRTEVFLGKMVADVEWKEKQRRKTHQG